MHEGLPGEEINAVETKNDTLPPTVPPLIKVGRGGGRGEELCYKIQTAILFFIL